MLGFIVHDRYENTFRKKRDSDAENSDGNDSVGCGEGEEISGRAVRYSEQPGSCHGGHGEKYCIKEHEMKVKVKEEHGEN